mmetsp:Transcript_23715/g.41610  ORF Transcript_23715/g.41610 Transcript_23715/m.41610 type:complete len:125 (-) Transcript_23715:100-474(-)
MGSIGPTFAPRPATSRSLWPIPTAKIIIGAIYSLGVVNDDASSPSAPVTNQVNYMKQANTTLLSAPMAVTLTFASYRDAMEDHAGMRKFRNVPFSARGMNQLPGQVLAQYRPICLLRVHHSPAI